MDRIVEARLPAIWREVAANDARQVSRLLRSRSGASALLQGAGYGGTFNKKPRHRGGVFVISVSVNQLPLTDLPFTVPSCSMMLYSLPSVSTCCRRTSR